MRKKYVIVRQTGADKLYLKEKDSLKVAKDKESAVKFPSKKKAQEALDALEQHFSSPSLTKYLTIEPYA